MKSIKTLLNSLAKDEAAGSLNSRLHSVELIKYLFARLVTLYHANDGVQMPLSRAQPSHNLSTFLRSNLTSLAGSLQVLPMPKPARSRFLAGTPNPGWGLPPTRSEFDRYSHALLR
jgi:hypothetical protein